MPKKKSQLKNPQRGFATTSTIKKKESIEDVEIEDTHLISNEPGTSDALKIEAVEATTGKSSTVLSASGHSTLIDWDANETLRVQEERQALADRVKAASEKEASKTLKVFDYEKRISSTFQEFIWDESSGIRDRIIALAIEESQGLPLKTYNESEEKLLVRLASLFLTLRKLGFSSAQVEECLRSVQSLELEDTIHWIYLRHSPNIAKHALQETDITPYGLGHWEDASLALPEAVKPTLRSRAPIEESSLLSKSSMSPSSDASKINGPDTPVLSIGENGTSLLAYRCTNSDDSSDEEESSTPARDTADTSASSQASSFLKAAISVNDGDGVKNEDEDDDPDRAFVAIKLQITTLQRKLGIAGKGGKKGGNRVKSKPVLINKPKMPEEMELENLEIQLKKIQSLYLFNAKKAEAAFAMERARLDKVELVERLVGRAKDRETDSSPTGSILERESKESAAQPVVSEIKPPSPEDTFFGDMLEGPANPATGGPIAEANEHILNEAGSVIVVRCMALPKVYTGKTSRMLLDDAVRRMDKFAKTSYRILNQGTRAIRAVVTIRWESGKIDQYGMVDEACENQDQAFQYAATLALFAVSTDGNAHRLLPPVFRDLWDELDLRRREAEASAYEKQLGLYRDLAELRKGAAEDQPIKSSRDLVETQEIHVESSPYNKIPEESGNFLQEQLLFRQRLPAYIGMLPVRQSLPIAGYRDHIISVLETNQVAVLCGETGCGKSTQTPTMILESELAKGRHVKIFCTEPRRISAISLAQRVSQELGEPPGSLGGRTSYVGYNIRLETKTSAATRLIYATTGILLRMLEGDTELEEITHIIIDEVHERSIDSDFLLIILKSLLTRRLDLRVLLMSATVDAEKLADYMGGCPIITVPGRTFPVTPYFLEDAVELCQYRLTLDSDSPYVQRMPRKAVRQPQQTTLVEDLAEDEEGDDENGNSQFRSGYSKQTQTSLEAMNEHVINFDLIISLLEMLCFTNPTLQPFSKAILVFLPSLETIRKLCDLLDSHRTFGSSSFHIFPLHSSISNDQQSQVFSIPAPGVRKIVVSTNIAETGVTIPDITTVIDSGRHKEMRFDEKRQISRLLECWIARSNSLQRRGRAGRVQEGICFHLFTKARLEMGLAEHPIPEMLRLSLQDLALRIKILKFSGSIENTLSQALDPPLSLNIQRAVASLIEIKALTATEDITQLGRHLVKLPLDVHTAKLCLLATIFGCVDAALTIAATLNSKSLFITPFGREAEADTIKRSFKRADEHSDFLVVYRAYKLWKQNCESGGWHTFCRKHFLSHQNLVQIEELKTQYVGNLIEAGFISSSNSFERFPKCPKIRFAKLEAHLDRASSDGQVIMAVVAAAMHPKLAYLDANRIWKTLSNNAPVTIHPSSSNFLHGRRPDFGKASFLTYFNIQQSKRLYIWEHGVVSEKAIMLLAGEGDVKHFANSASVDRKIRRHVERKSGLATDVLRSSFEGILLARFQAPTQLLSGTQARWLALLEEALASPEQHEKTNGRQEHPSMAISVVKRT